MKHLLHSYISVKRHVCYSIKHTLIASTSLVLLFSATPDSSATRHANTKQPHANRTDYLFLPKLNSLAPEKGGDGRTQLIIINNQVRRPV